MEKNHKDITTARYFNDYNESVNQIGNAKVHVLHLRRMVDSSWKDIVVHAFDGVVIAPKAMRTMQAHWK